MSAKQIIVKKTTRTRKRSSTPTKKGKGHKRCPSCGKYM